MMLGEMQHLYNAVSGTEQASEITQRTPLTLPFLQWTGMLPLDKLTYELHERKWIKSRKEFEGLFKTKTLTSGFIGILAKKHTWLASYAS